VDTPPVLFFKFKTSAINDPSIPPKLNKDQNIATNFPLSFSSGYDIIIAPCADQNIAAKHPKIAPEMMTKLDTCSRSYTQNAAE
jgi:hypothetical protein